MGREDLPFPRKRKSGGGMGILAVLISLVFIIGPFAVPVKIPLLSQTILVGFGVLLLLAGSIIVTVTRLYHKTSADEAFVRTGMGGVKAVVDGGAIVIPVVHEIVPVSLQTMKLTVPRSGADALITGDFLRADVTAEFFIKVQKAKEDVLNAATSLGHKALDPKAVESTVFEKLVNALRTVAATKPLADLNTKRDEFASAVQQIVQIDLKHNGLTLESVTISKLDQTSVSALKPEENVFDAQGARRIAEITQKAKVERNLLEREAEKSIKDKDVETATYVYNKEVDRATAEAERDKNIKVAKAKADQESKSVTAEQERLAETATVKKDELVQVAEVEKAKTIEVANQVREQAASTAEIEKHKAVELANRAKEISVAEAEKKRAEAQAQQLAAEADAERKRQEVKTIEVVATAERTKDQAVIAEKAEIEKRRLREQMEADVKAYTDVKTAEGEQQAAEKRAEARLVLAKADKEANVLDAEGQKAIALVPVEVEQRKVEVERQNLSNQQEFEKIARQLQVELAKISAEKDVRIEQAKAVGAALSATKMTIWGDPSTVTKMVDSFMNGQANGQFLGGLMDTTPEPVRSAATTAMGNVADLISAISERLSGKKITRQEAEEIAKEV